MGWQYEDGAQQLQGPFPLRSMQDWFAAGLLPLGTRVRRSASGSPELFELRFAPEIVGTKAKGMAEGTPELTDSRAVEGGGQHSHGRGPARRGHRSLQ